jgi:hypothetical protein
MIKLWQFKVRPPSHILPESAIDRPAGYRLRRKRMSAFRASRHLEAEWDQARVLSPCIPERLPRVQL